MKSYIIKLVEKFISVAAFIFPFTEVSAYFGAKVFLNADSVALKVFYLRHIQKLVGFYQQNVYFIFAIMIALFLASTRGSLPLSKYARFNIVQAILLNIFCSCLGATYVYLPVILRESMIGLIAANTIYCGIVLLIMYSSILIFYGRYPKIPVISEAARLQVQQSSLD